MARLCRYAKQTRHLAVCGVAALALLGAAEPQTNLADIDDEVMCPICGTTLELSEAPQAQRERAFIREQIAEGKSKEEIKAALVAEFGEEVLALPDNEGFDLAAWVVPVVGFALAAVAIAVGLRRWRRSSTTSVAPPATVSADEDERLRSDLARYDL